MAVPTCARSVSVRVLPVLLLMAFALSAASSLVQKSATYDESHYLGVGRYLLSHGDRDIPKATLHPPLASVIHGIPLWFVDIPDEIWRETNADVRGQRITALRSDDWLLNACRLALLPVAVALGWLVYAWSRRLYGEWGGLLSLTLYCFSPNLIAHARVITPDITLTATTVASGYALWRLAEQPARRRVVWAGVWVGLLLISKHTSLALVPLLAIADFAFRLQGELRRQRANAGGVSLGVQTLWSLVRHWVPILAIGFGIVWAAYGFDVGTVEVGTGEVADSSAIPAFAPDYFQAAYRHWVQSHKPHDFFLMGDYSRDGWWYFYLVVIAIKLPIATTALIAGLILAGRPLGMRFDARELFLWLPAVLFLVYLSFFNTIHNGLRYWLPVYPLLLIWAGKYARSWETRRWLRPVIGGALAWVVAASLWIWPDYLAYHNEWVGGPRNGYRWLSDSNLDWGQDLKQLKRYMDEHDIERIRLAYFGTADPAHYGIDYAYLPSATVPLFRTPRPPPGSPRAEVIALSAYQYQGVGFRDKTIYERFHSLEPNDLVGYSILIFDPRNPIQRSD